MCVIRFVGCWSLSLWFCCLGLLYLGVCVCFAVFCLLLYCHAFLGAVFRLLFWFCFSFFYMYICMYKHSLDVLCFLLSLFLYVFIGLILLLFRCVYLFVFVCGSLVCWFFCLMHVFVMCLFVLRYLFGLSLMCVP